MPYESVYDFNKIDLTRHALIEASAGTGKTYTIENLVIRLLKERDDVELENILLVTFTEKATSELKIRIREKLQRELKDVTNSKKTQEKLKNSLDSFDKASIYTIHGFCQTVLRDFAFENSTAFQNEVIDDAPLFETLLREQMRRTWPEIYEGHLQEVLEVSQFNKQKDAFLKTLTGLAKSIHREGGDKLLPDLEGRGFEEIKREIASTCLELKTLLGSDGKFSHGFSQLNFNSRARNSIYKKMVVPIEDYFSRAEQGNLDIRALSALMVRIAQTVSSGRKGTDCLIPEKWNQDKPNLEACPNIEVVKQKLEEINTRLRDLQCVLTVGTIYRLQDDLKRTKQNHGWISYFDMLTRVEKALYGDNSTRLLKNLRGRFKTAFIDEFQDTDAVQWKIFKKIFIDNRSDSLGNLLFLIGDPKQAIYSFRGGDVYVYLSAKNEMARLVKKDKARLYSLSTNWRSVPEMITVFNALFCSEPWFKPQNLTGPFEIGYQTSDSPGEDERPRAVKEDNSGRPVLNIVDLTKARSAGPAKAMLASFIAHEIKHLISSHIKITEKAGGDREIGFGDICILVRGKSDVSFVEEELTSLGIPYAFYKKPGLFFSDEARCISFVFHAILDPGNTSATKKALLTPFFGFDLPGLFTYEEMPPSHPAKEMLLKWNGYALSRHWSALFQSMMEESGLLFRETAESGWDRKYTNYSQIFEYLVEMAYRKNLDFRGLSATLDIYRREALNPDEDTGIHQIETEAQKVQIMTIHVSKGLEFPIVFLAGGLTQPGSYKEPYHTYHEVKKNGAFSKAVRIVDLTKMTGSKKHEDEKADENRRLYYVASTRAQFKLYLPFYVYGKQAPWLGPVCTLVSPALTAAVSAKKSDKNILFLAADHHSGVLLNKTELGKPQPQPTIPAGDEFELFPAQESYQYRKIRLESFSGLHRKMTRPHLTDEQESSFQTEKQKRKEDDESFGSEDMTFESPENEPGDMPGGIDVGLMFHDILEYIDYGLVLKKRAPGRKTIGSLTDDPNTREMILKQMEVHGINERWEEYIFTVIRNTLTTPVTPVGDGFSLAHLRKEDRLHEVEFYYSFPDRETHDGFIRGFVDLVFRKGQKFYIADWKSNYLETGYDTESMEKNMDHAHYHLQYKLYAIAILRWLKQTMADQFDPDKNFGGIFYFYLRGMGTGKGHGVYYVSPDKLGSLSQLEAEVQAIIVSQKTG